MNTNTANAKKTNSTRCRMSGTRSAARRLFSNSATLRQGRVFDLRACGGQRLARAVGEHDVAKTQAAGKRLAVLAAAQNFHAVAHGLDLLRDLERLRRHFHRRVPVREIVQIHYRVLRAEVADVARLLRVTAAMRKPALPRRLAALECGAFAAARTNRLTFAAFTAGFHHTGTVAAPDARALRPA